MFKIGDIVKLNLPVGVIYYYKSHEHWRGEVIDMDDRRLTTKTLENHGDPWPPTYRGWLADFILVESADAHKHTLKTYVGFTDVYDYCVDCGIKITP